MSESCWLMDDIISNKIFKCIEKRVGDVIGEELYLDIFEGISESIILDIGTYVHNHFLRGYDA